MPLEFNILMFTFCLWYYEFKRYALIASLYAAQVFIQKNPKALIISDIRL